MRTRLRGNSNKKQDEVQARNTVVARSKHNKITYLAVVATMVVLGYILYFLRDRYVEDEEGVELLKKMGENNIFRIREPLSSEVSYPLIMQKLQVPSFHGIDFSNTEVIYYNNDPENSPSNNERTNFIRAKHLTQTLIYGLKDAPAIMLRVAEYFFSKNGPTSKITLFTDLPVASRARGYYLPKNNSVRIIEGKIVKGQDPLGQIIIHEVAHAGAARITFGDPRKLPVVSLRNFRRELATNQITSHAFPCEGHNTFYRIWEQDAKALLEYRRQIFLNEGHEDEKLRQYLNIAAEYQPDFVFLLSENVLAALEEEGLAIGKIFNFSNTEYQEELELMFSDSEQYFAPKGYTSEDYYQKLLKEKDVQIVAITLNSGFSRKSAIYVTPVELEPKIRARFLFLHIFRILDVIEKNQESERCQETFARSMEFSRKVFEGIFFKSNAFLTKELDLKEQESQKVLTL